MSVVATHAESRTAGFTLLEMMVVVVLIALSVTIITLSLERDIDNVAEHEARRFAALIEYLRDESILSGRTYAVEVDELTGSYRFLTPGENWQPVERDYVLRARSVPEYLKLRFQLLEGAADESTSLLVVQGSGEISPFEFAVVGEDADFVVSVDAALNMLVERRAHEPG